MDKPARQSLSKPPLPASPSYVEPARGLIQRKCACGGTPGPSGECANCRTKRLAGKTPLIQTKLTVNQPGDRYEQEADHMADQVMRMPDPAVQRQVKVKDEDEEVLQTKVTSSANAGGYEVSPALGNQIHALQGGGQPLDPTTRAFMEPRFGHDFSQVRVHTDQTATEIAHSVNALAFTVGRDIVFGNQQYTPGTSNGKRLLAHELTHTIQQDHYAHTGGELHLARQDAGPGADGGVGGDAGVSPTPDAPTAPSGDAGSTSPSATPPTTIPATGAPPPVRLLRVEVHPDHRGHFPSIPGTGAGTHWVGVASATARKPIVRAVVDPAVPANDPRVAGITWSGPDLTQDPANPLQVEVDRMAGQRQITATLNGVSQSTTVWAVYATISATAGPTPTFVSNATLARPGATVNFSAAIFPNAILTATDRPRLDGPNDTAPPGGTSPATGNALSGGADHHWDISRKSRFRLINPSAIPTATLMVPGDAGFATIFGNMPWGYPRRWEEGNDDSSTADETNDPYGGTITSSDTPGTVFNNAGGANGDTLEQHDQFLEFVRLELNRTWWVISKMYPWRTHLRVSKVGGLWTNNGSDAASDNAGF